MSDTVFVDNSFNGSPLRPPISVLFELCNVSGRLIVVLLIINPPKDSCKEILTKLIC
jgi:hypothetical protein